MSKPAGYIVRSKDMKALLGALGLRGDQGAVYAAARTLIGWAEPMQTQQTQLPPVSVASLALPLDEPVNVPTMDALEQVHALAIQALGRGTDVSPGALLDITDVEPQPYDMPSPEADALDRIEAVIEVAEYSKEQWDAIFPVFQILRETGRL